MHGNGAGPGHPRGVLAWGGLRGRVPVGVLFPSNGASNSRPPDSHGDLVYRLGVLWTGA